jgi:hypothetical protein
MKKLAWGVAPLACAAILGAAAPAAAEGASPWIHVRVEEPDHASKVSVNVPLAVAEAVLTAAPSPLVVKGKLQIGHCHGGKGVSVTSLRQAWAELRKAGDADFVSVEDDDETVNVSRKGDKVHVIVTSTGAKKDKKKENVRLEVPVAAVDALLQGEGEELDVKAALAEIRKIKGDIVQVEDGDSHVRIWIDEGI